MFQATLAAVVLALSATAALAQSTNCTASSLNTTVGSWPTQATDTIYSIAAATNRGVCDIARANRMVDAEYNTTGEALIIPAEVCDPDNTTCLLVDLNPTGTCIYGGPHTYTTVAGDTITRVATYKLNITAASLQASVYAGSGQNYTLDEELAAGSVLKISQCAPSQCAIQPYKFTYGTYKDLAGHFNSTVGQIFGFNTGYRYSNATDALAPVISVPVNCIALSDNITIIS